MESRKALNFDLYNHLLEKYYPSKYYKNGWHDIRNFLENHDFIHRQYSGYVSSRCMPMRDVIYIIINMSNSLKWLKKCVKEFDVTIVSDEYSLLNYIYENEKIL